MKHDYLIKDGNLSLRQVKYEDLENMRNWRNKDDIRKCFINQDIISPEKQKKWFEYYLSKENDIMFMILWHDKAVGTSSLYDINMDKGSAEFGRLMIGDESVRGLGLGRRAADSLCNFGFNEMNLNQIYLEVFTKNKFAIDIYKSLGFICEKEISSEYENLYFMSINKERHNHGK